MVQDVKAGDLEARGKINTFLRALKGGLKTCPIVQRSIDIINNGLSKSGRSRTINVEETPPTNIMRNYLPAFPYGDNQANIADDNSYNLTDLDSFALLDSFPENHIDAVGGEWYLPP